MATFLKVQSEKILTDNPNKTIYESFRSECFSCRVLQGLLRQQQCRMQSYHKGQPGLFHVVIGQWDEGLRWSIWI